MRNIVFVAAAVTLTAVPIAKSQEATPLTDYLDANGFLDVQALTCAQLAGTYQEDADMLMAWYSGWYNGLARKHEMHYTRGKEVEHQVIVYCKENHDKRVIDAIAFVLKIDRKALEIEKE